LIWLVKPLAYLCANKTKYPTLKNYRFDLSEKTFFFIALLLTVFVRLRFADASLERDEGEYAYAGMMMLKGQLPYRDFYNMKLPGVYCLYALVFKLFGQSVAVIRYFLLSVNLLTAFLVFKTAKNWFNQAIGYWASGIFLLLSFSFHAQGWIANCEQFVNLFVAASFVFLTKRWLPFHLFFCGLMLGLATLMKQHAFHFVFFPAFLLLKLLFSGQTILGRFKTFLRLGTALALGYALPLAGTVAFFWQQGIFDAFYFYIVQYAMAYSTLHAKVFENIDAFWYIFVDNALLWLALFGALFVILKKSFTDPASGNRVNNGVFEGVNSENTEGLNLIILLGIGFVAVCPGWYFRPHYFQFLFIPAALMMAYCMANYGVLYPSFARKINRTQFVGLALLLTFAVQIEYFVLRTPEEMMARMYKWEYFKEVREISNYINNQGKGNAYIGQLANEPEIGFYTKTKAASGFLYAYPLLENHVYAQQFAEKHIKETESHHPDWFIYTDFKNKDKTSKTDKYLDAWAKEYLKHYELKGILYRVDKLKATFETNLLGVDTTREVVYEVYKLKTN
jgi:4-amino-4-deoxy-L-arabinose transferase-like glycosyltransferase